MKVVLGIPAFQLEKRIPSQSLLKGGRDEGCLGDPLFELESGNPARKADPQPIPPERGRDEGCLGDPLFELESGNPARKADPQPIPPERGP